MITETFMVSVSWKDKIEGLWDIPFLNALERTLNSQGVDTSMFIFDVWQNQVRIYAPIGGGKCNTTYKRRWVAPVSCEVMSLADDFSTGWSTSLKFEELA